MNIALIYDTFDTYDLKYSEYECDFCSIVTAESMRNAMIINGHSVEVFNTKEQILSLEHRSSEFDIVFNTFEGRHSRNREALIPAFLEFINIPFVGADASIAIITLNKLLIKGIAKNLGIMTPNYTIINTNISSNKMFKLLKSLNLPIIVKPIFAGNSEAIKVCFKVNEAVVYIQSLAHNYENLLCEEFIAGKELTVPIIGNGNKATCLGVTGYAEQTDDAFWLDSKYKVYGGFTDCKASITPAVEKEISTNALTLYNAINGLDYSRIDFRLSKDNTPYLLEMNAFPDLCENGSFATLYSLKGKSYRDLINDILSISVARNGLLPK